MKYAIISDIHGNELALKNVIKDARKQKCERIFCLGDVVGYGYAPTKCIELVQKNCEMVVMGNHDASVSGRLGLGWFNPVSAAGVVRDRGKVSTDYKAWLSTLKFQVEKDYGLGKPRYNAVFTHGSIDGGIEFPYIDSLYEASFATEILRSKNVDILFVGHTHYAVGYVSVKHEKVPDVVECSKDAKIDIKCGNPVIVNVGSVGYPRNQPFSCYAIMDDEERTVVWRTLKFDFKTYCKNLRDNEIPIPSWMDRWIDEGYVTEEDVDGCN